MEIELPGVKLVNKNPLIGLQLQGRIGCKDT